MRRRDTVRSHRANRVRGPWTAGMATVSSSACADDAHVAWGNPCDSPQSSRLRAVPSALVESGAPCPGPLADTVAVCRPGMPGPTAHGRDLPGALPSRVADASLDGGKRSRAASRRDGPFRSHEKPRGARSRRSRGIRPSGGVARDPAPSCADAATNPDRRGSARTASGARFFRPVGHGSRSVTSCRRRAGGIRRQRFVRWALVASS